jgi:E1A/CREB-binding protein
MKKRYAHKSYPDEFLYRRKCILVFQRLDGVDVLLFAMYVYEHGEDNPAPNTKVGYISYLDSVHFMRPKKIRTFVYRHILVAYLDYLRQKGFATAHVWACPPKEGDDYILNAKPKEQKTPSEADLIRWYKEMLQECQTRDICGLVTNVYDEYFTDKTLDATAVPYLEGDYFPKMVEDIIKKIGKKTKKRDEVMKKLDEEIKTMEKDSMIVAFLNCPSPHEGDVVAPNKFRLENAAGSMLRASIRNQLQQTQCSIKIIDDDMVDLDCEFFNSRQEFLGLSRDNQYQFSELRRAKHSSMMLLWHLHNPSPAEYIQESLSPPSVLIQADSNKENEVGSCDDDDNDDVGVKPVQPRMKDPRSPAVDRQRPDHRRGHRR